MSWATTFREIVSGRRRGVGAMAMRGLLSVVELPYSLAVRVRNGRYDRGRAKIHHVEVPVVSVGNLTLGGTGKTPMVKWIARWFRARGVRVSLVSRGYGAAEGHRNDEALELEQSLADVPHVQSPDRVAAARVAIDELETELIVADDAFQHRRLARDLEIVLIDALEPFGFGHVFPRGTLREPLAGLRRAELVCLTRADMVDEAERRRIEAAVRRQAPHVAWCEVAHAPTELLAASGNAKPLENLQGTPVAAFCGIGNPAGFRHTLAHCGAEVVGWREFPDHHEYTAEDLQSLGAWIASTGARTAVCTHKDLVKLQVGRIGNVPLWAVAVEMKVLSGEEQLAAALERVMR